MNELTLSERIDSVAKVLSGGNLSKLAIMLQIQPSLISHVKSGAKHLPKKCDLILRKNGINPDWIRTGDGKMYIGSLNVHGDGNNLHHLQNMVREAEVEYQSNKPLLDKIALLEGQVEFLKNELEKRNDQVNSLMELLKNRK